MKALIVLSVLLATPAFAGGNPEDNTKSCRTVTVCDAPKPKKKPAPKKKVQKVVEAPPKAPEPQILRETLIIERDRVVVKQKDCPQVEDRESSWLIGAHLGVGIGPRDPHFSGLLGVRARYKPFHLGAELYSAFNQGTALQLMGYTVQGKLSHHIDLGVVFNGKELLSTKDVPRSWDMLIGTGIEYRIHKNVSLTADWRMVMPNPVYIAQHSSPVYNPDGTQVMGEAGKYLDVKQVLGNSFTQSQFLLGVLLHNW